VLSAAAIAPTTLRAERSQTHRPLDLGPWADVAQTVGEVRGGSYIVGLRHADGSFRPQPAADTLLAAGDVVMAIGTARTLERLEELFTAPQTAQR
jgi:Trk K+ transport system NAD-binding subunit